MEMAYAGTKGLELPRFRIAVETIGMPLVMVCPRSLVAHAERSTWLRKTMAAMSASANSAIPISVHAAFPNHALHLLTAP